MGRRKWFSELPRPKQRLRLLRRLNAMRRNIEQYLHDLAKYNAFAQATGDVVLPDDPEMVRLLAQTDQDIRQIRDSQ